MRVLANDRAELIEALVAESSLDGITASLLEKDEHLTDALRAVFGLQFECVKLVFCGGTSLSKAHGLIERMSEDADLKVVLTDAGKALSRTKLKRYLGDEVRGRVARALADVGLVEDAERAIALNEYRYMHSQWSYGHRYPASTGLRPNLQLEFTVRAPVLPTAEIPLCALADRLAGTKGASFDVLTISVAETLAEKVLSFLRRFAQHRSGQMQQTWDGTPHWCVTSTTRTASSRTIPTSSMSAHRRSTNCLPGMWPNLAGNSRILQRPLSLCSKGRLIRLERMHKPVRNTS